jgi:HTH-type transcriptional regulator / antitoxin HigA
MTAIAKSRLARRRLPPLDPHKYGRLLARTLPTVIVDDAEYKRAIAMIGALLRKGDILSLEEDRLLDLLSVLVEKYEESTEDLPDSSPHRILRFLMEQNNLRQADLIKIFGSRGRVSEVVNGKRGISKAQAKSLSKFFKIPPETFI